jgi:hypothetical protein
MSRPRRSSIGADSQAKYPGKSRRFSHLGGLPRRQESGAANHPQSLWISLWVFPGRLRQVALPKGFFFFRSFFERNEMPLKNQ